MTLAIKDLKERLSAQFTDVQQVDDSIIRFTKTAGKQPFAVCYFDIADRLPKTMEALSKYQDRVIGKYYFEGRKSLQWNNYLYFVTSSGAITNLAARQAKELIESDRTYARKLVISEEEIDSVLQPLEATPAEAMPHANILSIWTEYLINEGLDAAIFSDDTMPARLKLIESSSRVINKQQPPKSIKQGEARASPFIRSLQLKKYRDYPVHRAFEFGKVNLVYGPNGSGKTSLLEAIELFYCGRNKRNPKAQAPYDLTATSSGGSPQNATNNRDLQIFRDRNLMWYGQSEVKASRLYQSFAQFNFLDTDAAVSLADSTARIEDDLSRLLVGPEASKTWRDIERVYETLSRELNGLKPRKNETEQELAILDKQLKDASDIELESDSISTRLEEMITRVGWSGGQGAKDTSAGKLVESLSELVPLVKQVVGLDWIESPVSASGLEKYCCETKNTTDKATIDIPRLEDLIKRQKNLGEEIKHDQLALQLTEEVKRLIDAGVPSRIADRNKLKNTMATYLDWLAGYNADSLGALSNVDLDRTVNVCHEAIVTRLSDLETLLATTKSEYENFSKLRKQSLNLAQELRQIAARILQDNPESDKCPLCHTQFDRGELAQHINADVNKSFEDTGQGFLTNLREQEIAVRDATATKRVLEWLNEFAKRANLDLDASVRTAFAEVDNAKKIVGSAQDRLEMLNKEILALESQGLSLSRQNDILGQLRELGYPLTDSTQGVVSRIILGVRQHLEQSTKALEEGRKPIEELRRDLKTNLDSQDSSVQELKDSLSNLKEELATVKSHRAMLSEFFLSFPWSREKPLSELIVQAELIRKIAAELQVAIERERKANAVQTDSVKRRGLLKQRLTVLKNRIERLSHAHSTLETLQTEHSLTNAMKSALKRNRVGIENIFSRIHAPAEFKGLGSNWTTLIREVDGIEAALSEVSTGQRSAFALSIFLAQNNQLRDTAPPVVLIDDPIAHIDDLNALSFLDYLREVVLTGGRQIFFATANKKIATLFERKFDFLGDDGFSRIDLSR